jgi:hypothetical protein
VIRVRHVPGLRAKGEVRGDVLWLNATAAAIGPGAGRRPEPGVEVIALGNSAARGPKPDARKSSSPGQDAIVLRGVSPDDDAVTVVRLGAA